MITFVNYNFSDSPAAETFFREVGLSVFDKKPMKETSNIIYSKPVIEFVTIGVEFCAILEKDDEISREEWLAKMSRILPLLYVRASLLPDTVAIEDEQAESFVREEDYARVAGKISRILGDEDVYLDVFVEDMKYSDTPISSFVSEDIADIYQDIRNFISIYQYEIAEQMYAALAALTENFKNYWGQKLVNVLRPLHALLYAENIDEDFENENDTEGGFWE